MPHFWDKFKVLIILILNQKKTTLTDRGFIFVDIVSIVQNHILEQHLTTKIRLLNL